MTVSGIEELSRAKCRVFLNGEPAFVLYKGELAALGIREGKDVPDEVCRQILEEILPKRAKLRCMNLLKSREYTEMQLMKKLLDGGYSHECALSAVAYVKSFGYVDDRRFTEQYIFSQREKKSRKQIVEQLRVKGVDKEIIDSFFSGPQEQEDEREQQLIRRLLQKKKYNSSDADYDQKQKIMAFLYRKGFSLDGIRKALEREEE